MVYYFKKQQLKLRDIFKVEFFSEKEIKVW